jgi:hypothetical protein
MQRPSLICAGTLREAEIFGRARGMAVLEWCYVRGADDLRTVEAGREIVFTGSWRRREDAQAIERLANQRGLVQIHHAPGRRIGG